MSAPTRTSAAESSSLADALSRDMRRRWAAGERPIAEEYFALHPEVAGDPEVAVDLIYEEFCLRQAAGEDALAADDLQRRFPRWAPALRVMLDCHRRLIESDRQQRPEFPQVGERVGDFLLTGELSRGARGRVFLARQSGLADRPVVLKLTPLDAGVEHLSLARLQHTHVVPLYCVVDDAARRMRVLCMPYFGGATLASVLASLADVPVAQRTGQHLLDAMDACEARDSDLRKAPASGAAREMLAHVSYVQAVCWIGACLADALHFAHERGLVHLDLKPSNVLLARDGQPMLLDFHLAREPIRPGGPVADVLGGTPAYMPPEQRAAMRSIGEGLPVADAVDARADVFALGAVLYEALGGNASGGALCHENVKVSTGLSDVLARCLAASVHDRYPTAAAVAEDLRRHLTDQPLAGVANRSVAERWQKWRRRRPNTLRFAAALCTFAAAAILVLATAAAYVRDRRAQASVALADGQRQLQNGRSGGDALRRGLELLDGVPFQHDLRARLQADLVAARRFELAGQLRSLADDVRLLYISDDLPPGRLAALAAQCETLWRRRGELDDSVSGDDLRDVALFAARAQPRPADALRLLDEAEAAFGASAVLDHERAARGGDARNRSLPARSAWEHVALGRTHLAAGDPRAASRALSAALALEPAARWANFYAGVCAFRTNRFEEARAAFSLCIGAAPDDANAFYNRALASAALGRPGEALSDCERALTLSPNHAHAFALREQLRGAAVSRKTH